MSKKLNGPDRFMGSVGEGVSSAFQRLAAEILGDGALPAKDKALIALACSVAVNCEVCVKRHQERASLLGASREEILEAAAVVGLVRMGSSLNTAAALLDAEVDP